MQTQAHSHFRRECVHGFVVAQCRCGSPNKRMEIAPCPPQCAKLRGGLRAEALRDLSQALEDFRDAGGSPDRVSAEVMHLMLQVLRLFG